MLLLLSIEKKIQKYYNIFYSSGRFIIFIFVYTSSIKAVGRNICRDYVIRISMLSGLFWKFRRSFLWKRENSVSDSTRAVNAHGRSTAGISLLGSRFSARSWWHSFHPSLVLERIISCFLITSFLMTSLFPIAFQKSIIQFIAKGYKFYYSIYCKVSKIIQQSFEF